MLREKFRVKSNSLSSDVEDEEERDNHADLGVEFECVLSSIH
jgi:hypothetical protein